jgi:hypothetical protein
MADPQDVLAVIKDSHHKAVFGGGSRKMTKVVGLSGHKPSLEPFQSLPAGAETTRRRRRKEAFPAP